MVQNVGKKLIKSAEVIFKPISRAGFFGSRVIIVVKSRLFQVPHVVYMRLDGFEKLDETPVFKDYSIRTYREGDEVTWTMMVKRSFKRLFPGDVREIYESRDFDPNGFFFLIYHGEAVGTVYAKQMQDGNSKVGCVSALCVVPEHQGKKLGRLLLLHSLHYFKSKGLQSAYLDVDEFNEPAIKTYRSAGFRFVSRSSVPEALPPQSRKSS